MVLACVALPWVKTSETMKEPSEFLTKEFFENPDLTLNALNDLRASNYVADFASSSSGNIYFMDVLDTPQTREILKTVISDFDAYITYNAAHFVTDEATELSMNALTELHRVHFGEDYCIFYRYENFMYV